MSDLDITEAHSVQFPMVVHATEIGWTPLPPDVAKAKRSSEDAMLFREDLTAKLRDFNTWLNDDAIRQIIEKLEALRPNIEGNHEVLQWLRGERSWYDEAEKRHRSVRLIDFENTDANVFHVTWEWKAQAAGTQGQSCRRDVPRQWHPGVPRGAQEPERWRRHRARHHATAAVRKRDT